MLKWRRNVAFLAGAALVVAAPGLPCYEAAAQVVQSASRISGGGSARLGASGASIQERSYPLDAGLSAPAPSLAPALQAALMPNLELGMATSPGMDALTETAAAPGVSLGALLVDKDAVLKKISTMPASQAKKSSDAIMDEALRVKSISQAADETAAAGASVVDIEGHRGVLTPLSSPESGLSSSHSGDSHEVPGPDLSGGPVNGGGPGGKWQRFKTGFLRVWHTATGILSDKAHNNQFWVFITGQALIVFGIAFFHTALAGLVVGAAMGYLRAINWGFQAAASFGTGPLIDKTSSSKIFVSTFLGRAVFLIAAAPLLISGHYIFAGLAVIVAITSFLQSMGLNAGSAVFTRILGNDRANYNKANAVYNLWIDGIGTLGNLASIWFISYVGEHAAWLAAHFGANLAVPLIGNILCFPFYSLMLLGGLLWYHFFLRAPRDELVEAQRGLTELLRVRQKSLLALALALASLAFTHLPPEAYRQAKVKIAHYRALASTGPKIKGVALDTIEQRKTLVIQVVGDPAALTDLPKEFGGFPVIAVAKPSQLKELREGLDLIAKDHFLSLTMVFSTVYVFVADAIPFTGIPTYVKGILNLTGKEEVTHAFGLLGAYISAGLTVATVGMMVYGWIAKKQAAKASPVKILGLDPMERQGKWSSILLGVAMLLYWSAFFAPNIWASAITMLVLNVAAGPAGVVWSSLFQRVVSERYSQDMGKIYSAMYFYQLLWQVAGVLAFSALSAYASPVFVLTAFCAVLSVAAVLDIIVPFLVFPIHRGHSSGSKS